MGTQLSSNEAMLSRRCPRRLPNRCVWHGPGRDRGLCSLFAKQEINRSASKTLCYRGIEVTGQGPGVLFRVFSGQRPTLALLPIQINCGVLDANTPGAIGAPVRARRTITGPLPLRHLCAP
jgi:hypothetical protein